MHLALRPVSSVMKANRAIKVTDCAAMKANRVTRVVATTIPGFRSPEQPAASVHAMLEETPEAFWDEIEPLVRDFKVAVPPQ